MNIDYLVIPITLRGTITSIVYRTYNAVHLVLLLLILILVCTFQIGLRLSLVDCALQWFLCHSTNLLEDIWELAFRNDTTPVLIEDAEHIIDEHIWYVIGFVVNEVAEGLQVDSVCLLVSNHIELASDHLIVAVIIFEIHWLYFHEYLQTLLRESLEHICQAFTQYMRRKEIFCAGRNVLECG